MYKDEVRSLKQKFEQVISKLKEEFGNIRTGQASTGLVENIAVTYYGSQAPLKQMATITINGPSQIVIIPWDKNSLGDIELAIRNSDSGLAPINDGHAVRVALPPMTEERRDQLIKSIHSKGEEARVALRTLRGEVWEKAKKQEKAGELTEDDRYGAEKELNEIIADYNKRIEELSANKEKDLRAI